jgi:leucine dehydrogenase
VKLCRHRVVGQNFAALPMVDPYLKGSIMDSVATRASFLATELPHLTDITAFLHGYPDFDGHEQVLRVTDPQSGLRAIIALHDTTLGPAMGGCRMWPYENDEAALTDVLRLSRGMSYKAAMAGIAGGGGKSVIIGNPATDRSEALFRAFGRAIDALGGRYLTGEDVGVTVENMNWAASETPYVLGSGDRGGDPGPVTAHGIYVGIRAALRHRFGHDDLDGVTVAVQGMGSVGAGLCDLLHQGGARLVIADVNEATVAEGVRRFKADVVAPDEIYGVEADVFAPCALGAVINDDTVVQLRCAIVAGSANNQLHQDRHGEILRQRNILYAPDYVINAGGIIAFSTVLSGEGYSLDRAMDLTTGLGDTLAEIFTRAETEGIATSAIADRMAVERVRAGAKDKSP